jgi:hypothetical protein
MKNTFAKTLGTMAMAVLLTAAAQISVFAQDANGEKQIESFFETPRFGNPRALEGTWDAQVTVNNCQTGAVIRTFASIGTFMSGGTMLDSTSGIPQALKTPGHGVWEHLNGRRFRFKFKSFNFDAAGNFTGWTIITHIAEVNPGAKSYTSAGTGEFFDRNGNPTPPFMVCSTTTATRFE